MSRTAKIAAAAALGGLLMALTIGLEAQPNQHLATGITQHREDAERPAPRDLSRCRTLTMPDSGCDAAWDAKRRRFFGKDER